VGSIAQYLNPSLWGDWLKTSASGLQHATFWIGVLQILLIDFLLSGDNAVVIAMACRGLAPRQRFWGVAIGVSLAVLLRIIFAAVATQLMEFPYLKLVGGLALLYIAVKLLMPEAPDRDQVKPAVHLWGAIRIVVAADAIMSLDNILPVAAVARGNLALLLIGLAGAIPLIIIGATIIMALLDRFPILVWAGAALLGWIAGDLMAVDPAVAGYLTAALGEKVAWWIEMAAAGGGAPLVVAVGAFLRRGNKSAQRAAD